MRGLVRFGETAGRDSREHASGVSELRMHRRHSSPVGCVQHIDSQLEARKLHENSHHQSLHTPR